MSRRFKVAVMLHPGADGTAAEVPTEHIHVGVGVMVLALRDPAWAAKQLATLQHVSGGRVVP